MRDPARRSLSRDEVGRRPPLVPPDTAWRPYRTLAAAREWSLQRVGLIERRLVDLHREVPALRCVVLTGSLARLDAGPGSDVDLIIVLHDDVPPRNEAAATAVRAVWERLAPMGLRRPQAEGVFVSPTSRRQLCDGPRGIVTEAVDVFGKRMQMLLEARPVLQPDPCRQLQHDILRRYAEHPFRRRPGECWSYLTDDLMRYWRSYRVWRQWDASANNGGWWLRNLKLRHSRLLSFAALLSSCLSDVQSTPGDQTLPDLLPLTPLERLWRLDQQSGDAVFPELCRRYDRFLRILHDVAPRRKWERMTAPNWEAPSVDAPSEFSELLDNADELQLAVWRLITRLAHGRDERILAKLLL